MSSNPRTLKPLHFPLALLSFGIPAHVFVLSAYYLMAFVMEFMGFSLFLLVPIVGAILR